MIRMIKDQVLDSIKDAITKEKSEITKMVVLDLEVKNFTIKNNGS
jgi:hypothetical protein